MPSPTKKRKSIPGTTPLSPPVTRHTVMAPVECPVEFIEEIRTWGFNHGGSGGLVEFCNPEMAAVALWRLAQGTSITRIKQETGLDRETITRLRFRQADTLEAHRKQFSIAYAKSASVYNDLLMDKADRLMANPELLDDISPDKLALTVGIMTDKATQLSGMPGIVIEHRKGISIGDAAAMIEEIRAKLADRARDAAIECQIVDDEVEDY